MKKKHGGLILTSHKFKDRSFEHAFGSAPEQPIIPLNRDTNVPVIYQGDVNSCVVCTATWIRQWYDKEKQTALSWPFLARESHLKPKGATPQQVFDPARKIGICTRKTFEMQESVVQCLEAAGYRMGDYFFLKDYSKQGIYHALKQGPLAIGILNYEDIGNHMMAGVDVQDGKLVCINWWDEKKTQKVLVDFKDVELAISFAKPPVGSSKPLPASYVLKDKVISFFKYRPLRAAIITGLALLASLIGSVQVFGAGYVPVTGYETRLTQRIDKTDSTIPVSSVKDKAGRTIDLSSVSSSSTVRAYFILDQGKDREEPVYCTGISGTSWTGCVRGLDFQGGTLSASSTLAEVHLPGARMVMTNIGQFFGEYLSRTGTQTKYDVLTFDSFPVVSSTTALPVSNGQLATKYYVDSVGAGGFTASNVGTSYGLYALGTSPETVGINISATSSGLTFNSVFGYKLMVNASSTKGLKIDSDGYLAIDESDDFIWSGSNSWTGSATFTSQPVMSTGERVGPPVGSITAYSTSTPPTGWLLADGSSVSSTTYGDLYAVIGTYYGNGGGGTNSFSLPRLNGRTLVMTSSTETNYDALGEIGGATSTNKVVAHTHTVPVSQGINGSAAYANHSDGSSGQTTITGGAINSGNSASYVSVQDPYFVVNYIIKY